MIPTDKQVANMRCQEKVARSKNLVAEEGGETLLPWWLWGHWSFELRRVPVDPCRHATEQPQTPNNP